MPPRRSSFVSKKRPLDIAVAAFMLINVPIILLCETQLVLPSWCFPKFLHDVVKWHIRVNQDFLVRDTPHYFKGLVIGDIFIRLPLLFFSLRGFYRGKDWSKFTGTVYGLYTTTTMIPLLSDIFLNALAKKGRMAIFYMPQLVVALYILYRVLPVAFPTFIHAPRRSSRHSSYY